MAPHTHLLPCRTRHFQPPTGFYLSDLKTHSVTHFGSIKPTLRGGVVCAAADEAGDAKRGQGAPDAFSLRLLPASFAHWRLRQCGRAAETPLRVPPRWCQPVERGRERERARERDGLCDLMWGNERLCEWAERPRETSAERASEEAAPPAHPRILPPHLVSVQRKGSECGSWQLMLTFANSAADISR